ncbi:MAG: PepSY domain-containing protein [Gammaproteobacteria bacterium]|nr:PepSY domain-containing protein [Gammaproteobacteria bacterium]
MKTTIEKNSDNQYKKLYALIWRWHFYAGLIFLPIIMLLAISGGIYLFEPYYNESIRDEYLIKPPTDSQTSLSVTQQIYIIKKIYPTAKITAIRLSNDAHHANEISLIQSHASHSGIATPIDSNNNHHNKVISDASQTHLTVFLNPYTGEIVGKFDESQRWMPWIRELHGELLLGKFGTKFVELAACWALVLLISGFYLWWPRGTFSPWGLLLPRLKSSKRIFWRDIHSVTGIYLSILLSVLLISGLPWTDIWGGSMHLIQKRIGQSSEPAWLPNLYSSVVPDKLTTPIGIDTVIHAINKKISQDTSVNINFPKNPDSVYHVIVNSPNPAQQCYFHIDQYTGAVLGQQCWEDMPLMARAIEIGVAIHEGHYFGTANLVLCLITALGTLLICISGIIMWWQRRPESINGFSLASAPPLPKNFNVSGNLIWLIILLGILLPALGISLLLLWIIDSLVQKYLKYRNPV